jgi:hypothetical protein
MSRLAPSWRSSSAETEEVGLRLKGVVPALGASKPEARHGGLGARCSGQRELSLQLLVERGCPAAWLRKRHSGAVSEQEIAADKPFIAALGHALAAEVQPLGRHSSTCAILRNGMVP